MRVFSIVNVALWFTLLFAWIPYVTHVGMGDPVSVDVMVILAATAGLMVLLGIYRVSGHRHILG